MLFLNIIFGLLALAMIVLILMQRGAGAQAGSGFGGGASGTVFGARGSSSFLTKTTKWMAIAFFALSMFMAYQATRDVRGTGPTQDLGVMSAVPVAPVSPRVDGSAVPVVPTQTGPVPQVPSDRAVPAIPVPAPAEAAPPAPQPDPAQAPASGD